MILPLIVALEQAWCAETSASPDWSPERPSLGQCAVTALVVQDVLGGDLLRAVVNGESHYWNRLPNGSPVDLTLDQFDRPVIIEPPAVRDRSYVLSFPETAKRYQILRERLEFFSPGVTTPHDTPC